MQARLTFVNKNGESLALDFNGPGLLASVESQLPNVEEGSSLQVLIRSGVADVRELDELLQKIHEHQYFCEVKFEDPNSDTAKEFATLFSAAYLNNRNHKQYAHLKELAKIGPASSKTVIRTAKQNLKKVASGEDEGASVPGLQIQQQQQMQVSVKRQHPLTRKKIKKEEGIKDTGINPLTIVEKPPVSIDRKAEEMQLYLRMRRVTGIRQGLNPAAYQGFLNRFNTLFIENKTRDVKFEALNYFINATTQDEQLKQQIQNALKNFPEFKIKQLEGLGKILMHAGPEGVAVFLNKLSDLKNSEPALYKYFSETFLKNEYVTIDNVPYPSNVYLQFISDKGLATLQKLKQLSPAEKTWWLSLSYDHKDPGHYPDFVDLFEAFTYFKEQLHLYFKDNLKMQTPPGLPPKCNFLQVGHMKKALQRILDIVKSADFPDEQLLSLDDLDLSDNGAIKAIQADEFKLVTKEMKLIPRDANEIDSYRVTLEQLIQAIPGGFLSEMETLFYRYLGGLPQEEVFHPFSIYGKLIDLIKTHLNSDALNLTDEEKIPLIKVLVSLLAIVATGPRAAESIYPEKDLKQILQFVSSEIEYMQHKYKNMGGSALYTFTNLHNFCDAIATNNRKDNPNFEDLLKIFNAISKIEDPNKRPELLRTIGTAIKYYGSSVYLILDAQEKRLELERAKSDDKFIAGINLPSLFKSISNNNTSAELVGDKDQAGIFQVRTNKDDKELLTNFISILSRIANPENKGDIVDLARTIKNFQLQPPTSKDRLIVDLVLAKLLSINISRSTMLPSMDEIKKIFENLKKSIRDVDDPYLFNDIQRYIETALPGTVFGSGMAETSKFELVKYLKKYMHDNKIDLQEQINNIFKESDPTKKTPKYKQVLEFFYNKTEISKSIKEFSDELQKASPSFEQLQKLLAKIEKQVRGWIETVPNIMMSPEKKLKNATKLALSKSPDDETLKARWEQTIREYFQNYSMAAFIKIPLEDLFTRVIVQILRPLHLRDKSFEDTILKHLGKVDVTLSIDRAVEVYNARFNDCITLINAFIPLNNLSDVEFKKACEIFVDYNALLDFPTHTKIIQFFADLEPISVPGVTLSSVMMTVYQNIDRAIKNPNYSNEKLDKTLNELTILLKINDLDEQLFRKLLNLSVSYNLTHEAAFPLTDLQVFIDFIYAKREIPKKQSKEMVQNMLSLLQHAEGESVSPIINKVIQILSGSQTVTTIQMLNLLLNFAKSALHVPAFEAILQQLPIEKADLLKQMTTILVGSAVDNGSADTLNIDQVQKLLQGLVDLNTRSPEVVQQLTKLYQYWPAPNLNQLVAALYPPNRNKLALNDTITKFINSVDNDPTFKRANGTVQDDGRILKRTEIIAEQFSLKKVKSIATEMKDLLNQTDLSPEKQSVITQQFVALNALGYKEKIKTVAGVEKILLDFSRDELSALAKQCFDELKKLNALIKNTNDRATKDGLDTQKEAVQLKLLAVLREIMFRVTGKVPYPTQMFSVLMSLRHPNNLLLQINTGQGKTLTTALLAVMQWTEGQTVDVCTANRMLAKRDYTEEHMDKFYNFLDIPSANVLSQSDNGTYQVGGINYSTIADISLYRARARLEKEDLRTGQDRITGAPTRFIPSVILDEVDYSTLDDRTLFNYAVNPEIGIDSNDNPYAWVYPLINEFVDSEDFLRTNEQEGAWSSNEDVRQLHMFLYNRANQAQRLDLEEIAKKDNKLSRWLDAACSAKMLVENKSFQLHIEEQENPETKATELFATAVPLVRNEPQPTSTFSDGVQQLLHARLDKEKNVAGAPKLKFAIDPEMMFISSESAKEACKYYTKEGRLIGLSATLGTIEELRYQRSQFGVEAFSIPPYQESKLQKKAKVKKNKKETLAAIKDTFKSAKRKEKPETRPIAVFCEDPLHARKLFADLYQVEYKDYALALQHYALIGAGKSVAIQDPKPEVREEKQARAIATFKQLANGLYKHNEAVRKILLKIKLKDNILSAENLNPEEKFILQKLSGDENALRVYDIFNKILKGEYTENDRNKDMVVLSALAKSFRDTQHEALFETIKTVPLAELTEIERRLIGQWINKLTVSDLQLIDGSEKEDKKEDKTKKDRTPKWALKAGRPNTITITTSFLARGVDIKAQHPEGLLIVQPYAGTERDDQQTMGRTARNGQNGTYVVIYDKDDILHRYHTDFSKDNWQSQLKKMQKQRTTDDSVQRHYIQEADQIQNIVMQHFDRWQDFSAFLLNNNQERIKKEVLPIREQLIQQLKNKWQEKLNAQKPGNPYIQKDAQGNNVYTNLDAAVVEYEEDVVVIWHEFKTKIAKEVILENIQEPGTSLAEGGEDVNTLRYLYLDKLELKHDIEIRKLEYRQQQKEEKAERQVASRTVDYALDEDRALLAYATTAADKQKFVRRATLHQLQLVLEDFKKNFYPRLTLTRGKRDHLNRQVEVLLGMIDLELNKKVETTEVELRSYLTQTAGLLHSVTGHFPRLKDKFAMQPLVGNVLAVADDFNKVYENIAPIPEITNLKIAFIDDAVNGLIANLKNSLSWAAAGQETSLEYRIERKPVQRAAKEILQAIQQYESADPNAKALAFKNLIKIFEKQKIKLDDLLWIPALGHENIKTTIRKALNVLSMVSRISSEEFKHSLRQMHDHARSDAILEKYVETFVAKQIKTNTAFEKEFVKIKQPNKEMITAWNKMMNEIGAINNQSYFAFDEMLFCLEKADGVPENYKKRMMNDVKQIQNEIRQKHPQLISSEAFVQNARTKLDKGFQQLKEKHHWAANYNSMSLTIDHSGFREQYELIIDSSQAENKDSIFRTTLGMTQYHDVSESEERKFLDGSLQRINDELAQLTSGAMDASPDLSTYIQCIDAAGSVDPIIAHPQFQHLLSKELQVKLNAIQKLQEFLFTDDVTTSLSNVLDPTMNSRIFTLQNEIKEINKQILQLEAEEKKEKRSSYFGRLVDTVYSAKDSMFGTTLLARKEALESERKGLQVMIKNEVRQIIADKSNEVKVELKKLKETYRDNAIQTKKKQIEFLTKKIDKQAKKKPVLVRVFKTIKELLAFQKVLEDEIKKPVPLLAHNGHDHLLDHPARPAGQPPAAPVVPVGPDSKK